MTTKPLDVAIIVLKALRVGMAVDVDGRKLVWLEDKKVGETPTHDLHIDGLAIEGRKYKPGEDYNDPNGGEAHYMGMGDISINTFVKMCDEMSDKELDTLAHDVALNIHLRDKAKKRGKVHGLQ